MERKTKGNSWNPYIAGALVGILAVASAFTTTRVLGRTSFLGASTTFVRAAGFVERSVVPARVEENEYFTKQPPRMDWQFMLVLGILAGAMAASFSDKSFELESVPPIWAERFGKNKALRGLWAFMGGIIAMIGARLADGCPSGHGLSGMMQLSVSGFTALIFFFGTGIVSARIIYRRRG